jgi:biopolymer transport protein ExbD
MSHGPASGDRALEPNFTPLLDVVLQLLMFFMMCVNFVNEQVSRDIRLPVSQVAAPMNKGETDVLFINLKAYNPDDFKDRPAADRDYIKKLFHDAEPGKQQLCALIVGAEYPKTAADLKAWLEKKYTYAKADAEKTGDGTVKTIIIIRADKELEYEHVFAAMKLCEEAKFPRLKLRAIIKNKGTS